ncbi:MAG: carotenoid biosynthesis protein [FCB group bacterium]|nr:carotenoid biosynthesis protein [FCB group bacterium]
MPDSIFLSILIPLILSAIFGYRFLERTKSYAAAERLRIIQMLIFLLLFGFHGMETLGLFPFLTLLFLGFILSFILEYLGVNRGWIFGSYHYTNTACPLPSFGGVPLCFPVVWSGLIYAGFWTALLWLPTDGGALTLSWNFILLTAVLVTILDLILDPIAVDEGRWIWKKPGRYYGIPWTNFAGWLLTVILVLTVFRFINGPLLILNTPTVGARFYPGFGFGMLAAISTRVCLERKLIIPAILSVLTAIVIFGRIVFLWMV